MADADVRRDSRRGRQRYSSMRVEAEVVEDEVREGDECASGREEAEDALDVGFVAIDAGFEFLDAAGLSVADERAHLRFEFAEVGDDLCFEIDKSLHGESG
jgi:hypothetical protein